MKVGTDGVLLGAWVDVTKAKNVLDIGSGTGLISLMIAQRNQNAHIVAIEIDELAAKQANQNFNLSPWKERLSCNHISLQAYTSKSESKFDLIVSNPPFYPSEHFTESASFNRKVARNQDTLTFEELMDCSSRLLSSKGNLSVIIPISELEILNEIALKNGLQCIRLTEVKSKAEKAIHRVLATYSFQFNEIEKGTLTIQNEKRNDYTEQYQNLTKDFHTIF